MGTTEQINPQGTSLAEITPSQPLVADFEPSEKQLDFLRQILNPKSEPELDTWLNNSRVANSEFLSWRSDPAFVAWLTREVESSLAFYRLEWLRIGIFKMRSDKDTWREMGKIFYPEGLREPITDDSRRGQLEQTAVKLMETMRAKIEGRK